MSTRYEPVIGLEVHCQLLTDEKLFCGCPTRFGAEINAQTCPICLGMPGVLPVLNPQAVDYALKAGLALGCTVNRRSHFARKHYFYPDLPKGYQITQYEIPVLEHGRLEFDVDGVTISAGIHRIHMEEDAGKSLHADTGSTLVDLNRAGVPLVEIVGEPDLRSVDQAVAYLKALHAIVRYLGICDGNMEEGSFRCDANVSVRPVGQQAFGTRVEIKNMNTFKGIHRALTFEVERQIAVNEDGGTIVQETRLWDDAAGRTRAMRSKEEAHDYRYFPEPDLPPLDVSEARVAEIRATLPELPRARRQRFESAFGLSAYDAGVLTSERALADYFEAAVAAHADPKNLCNWLTTELLGRVPADRIGESPIAPQALARLVALIGEGTISGRIAKDVFEAMFAGEGTPDEIVSKRGLVQVSDAAAIEAVVREVIAKNPGQVEQFRSGKAALKGYFVGQVMKAMGGKANPKLTNEIVDRLLAGEGK
jgi:aspartyl-tRNA(Asn)/glutamyl-tRNA(Gln) amidotransferase subunit B